MSEEHEHYYGEYGGTQIGPDGIRYPIGHPKLGGAAEATERSTVELQRRIMRSRELGGSPEDEGRIADAFGASVPVIGPREVALETPALEAPETPPAEPQVISDPVVDGSGPAPAETLVAETSSETSQVTKETNDEVTEKQALESNAASSDPQGATGEALQKFTSPAQSATPYVTEEDDIPTA